MLYLGLRFKNVEEIKEWDKQGAINYYHSLCKMFNANPSMELSVVMSLYADVLVHNFGMTFTDVENIEMSVMCA